MIEVIGSLIVKLWLAEPLGVTPIYLGFVLVAVGAVLSVIGAAREGRRRPTHQPVIVDRRGDEASPED